MELEIEYKGQTFVCLYDDIDRELILRHKWRYSQGYASCVAGKMHRLILNLNDPKILVDHINHNKLDNRRCNIRPCTHAQNLWNRKRTKKEHLKGVRKNRNLWRSSIKKNGEFYILGHYRDDKTAAFVYDAAAKILYGEFACPNFTETRNIGIQLELPLKSRQGYPFNKHYRGTSS